MVTNLIKLFANLTYSRTKNTRTPLHNTMTTYVLSRSIDLSVPQCTPKCNPTMYPETSSSANVSLVWGNMQISRLQHQNNITVTRTDCLRLLPCSQHLLIAFTVKKAPRNAYNTMKLVSTNWASLLLMNLSVILPTVSSRQIAQFDAKCPGGSLD